MPTNDSTLRDAMPWIAGAMLVVLAVGAYLWWTQPEENLLPQVYEVM